MHGGSWMGRSPHAGGDINGSATHRGEKDLPSLRSRLPPGQEAATLESRKGLSSSTGREAEGVFVVDEFSEPTGGEEEVETSMHQLPWTCGPLTLPRRRSPTRLREPAAPGGVFRMPPLLRSPAGAVRHRVPEVRSPLPDLTLASTFEFVQGASQAKLRELSKQQSMNRSLRNFTWFNS